MAVINYFKTVTTLVVIIYLYRKIKNGQQPPANNSRNALGTNVYRIQKIRGQWFNKKTGEKQLLVQWRGHAGSSWINERDLIIAHGVDDNDDESEF
jgi:hypothetical protein